MIFPGFPGVLSFFQVFQVKWEPWMHLFNSVQPGRSELICLHWMIVVKSLTALLHTYEFFAFNTMLPETAMLASKDFQQHDCRMIMVVGLLCMSSGFTCVYPGEINQYGRTVDSGP